MYDLFWTGDKLLFLYLGWHGAKTTLKKPCIFTDNQLKITSELQGWNIRFSCLEMDVQAEALSTQDTLLNKWKLLFALIIANWVFLNLI